MNCNSRESIFIDEVHKTLSFPWIGGRTLNWIFILSMFYDVLYSNLYITCTKTHWNKMYVKWIDKMKQCRETILCVAATAITAHDKTKKTFCTQISSHRRACIRNSTIHLSISIWMRMQHLASLQCKHNKICGIFFSLSLSLSCCEN